MNKQNGLFIVAGTMILGGIGVLVGTIAKENALKPVDGPVDVEASEIPSEDITEDETIDEAV